MKRSQCRFRTCGFSLGIRVGTKGRDTSAQTLPLR